jgi:hypothetical protein
MNNDDGWARLRAYGLDQIRQDPDNGTWWIGSDLRPDLLNMDSPTAAADYLDTLPQAMIDRLRQPRGSDIRDP